MVYNDDSRFDCSDMDEPRQNPLIRFDVKPPNKILVKLIERAQGVAYSGLIKKLVFSDDKTSFILTCQDFENGETVTITQLKPV